MKQDFIVKAPKLPNLRPYENKWVALSPQKDRVVSSGDTLKEVAQKLTPREQKEVSFMKVFPFDTGYAPNAV